MASNKQILVLLLFTLFAYKGVCQIKILEDKNSIYNVKALLNDSMWYGKAHIVKEHQKSNRQFLSLNFINNLSYKDTASSTSDINIQLLSMNKVPLVKGRFKVLPYKDRNRHFIDVRYDLLSGGDAIADSYSAQSNTNSWIEIIKYNPELGLIEGLFNLELINKTGHKIYFRKGTFKSQIEQK